MQQQAWRLSRCIDGRKLHPCQAHRGMETHKEQKKRGVTARTMTRGVPFSLCSHSNGKVKSFALDEGKNAVKV